MIKYYHALTTTIAVTVWTWNRVFQSARFRPDRIGSVWVGLFTCKKFRSSSNSCHSI